MSFNGTEFKPGDVVCLNDAGRLSYGFSPTLLKEFGEGVTLVDVARADEWYALYRANEGIYFKYIEHAGGPW